MNVAIYCGSQTGKNPIYIEKAKELGEQLAKAGLGIVYGGSTVGLMGALADSALAHKGRVIGIMPEHLTTTRVDTSPLNGDSHCRFHAYSKSENGRFSR